MAGLEHRYRLILREDGIGSARTIEFEAPAADAALFLAERHCAGRDAELFEDERSLGHLENRKNGGFWVLSPSPAPDAETVLEPE